VRDFEADAIHLDSPTPGSGQAFDWALVDKVRMDQKLILAGGLTPDNVHAAIQRVHPWGVDVSTGVERSPGRKDATKVMRFVNNAKAVGEQDPFELDLDADGRPIVEPYDFDWEEDTSVR